MDLTSGLVVVVVVVVLPLFRERKYCLERGEKRKAWLLNIQNNTKKNPKTLKLFYPKTDILHFFEDVCSIFLPMKTKRLS